MRIQFGKRFPSCVYYLVAKKWHAPDDLFGRYKTRQKYTYEQAQDVFGQIWEGGLEKAIYNKKERTLDLEAIQEEITVEERKYFDPNLIHRRVRYKGFSFIAQLTSLEDGNNEIDQLWFVHSHSKKDFILCVEFESHDERMRFHDIARRKGFYDGRILLQEYTNALLAEND